ncbi:hypothetical protein I0C86_41805 [Plantactinospora sp. S1510]|uniref:Lantibiotic dehydratase N-terminal domain-containing protein n=1 Tax=Plantactinospora alkalitolerans TaxID=2789879 RepID=A0ABS0HAM5_9ACTN|nr:hypothetical protein [Plantactinospora alkalitolerans]MBF9135389.1 hypothetical protein [Plantactinospora alkalitolerans]
MHSRTVNGDSRPSFWPHVREFAVPLSMIESATARRATGDWAGACAAARVDVDLNLRSVADTHGRELASRVRTDLRHLAPDLLRWHMPRIAPDGLLRPGLTMSLARYHAAERSGGNALHLVARTPPAWADAGQRISLALWGGTGPRTAPGPHPHPRPDRRFRLDLHRHLWDARRTDELRIRSGADQPPADGRTAAHQDLRQAHGCAVDRWAAEAEILLRADGRVGAAVAVRLGARHRLVLELAPEAAAGAASGLRIRTAPARGGAAELPVLPDAAVWVLPDLALLRAGLVEADRLHPLVTSALVPGHPPDVPPRVPDGRATPRLVPCRGAQHRIGLVNGTLVPFDHDPAEIRREELLAALTGTPLPCLQVIDEAHRRPECLVDVRARLDHGDTAGALAAVEELLGPEALLRDGALRDELETAALRRVRHGLFRAGLAGLGAGPVSRSGPRRRQPRRATTP